MASRTLESLKYPTEAMIKHHKKVMEAKKKATRPQTDTNEASILGTIRILKALENNHTANTNQATNSDEVPVTNPISEASMAGLERLLQIWGKTDLDVTRARTTPVNTLAQQANVQTFANVFDLGKHANLWKNGIRIWPQASKVICHSTANKSHNAIIDKILEDYLENQIIRRSKEKNPRFVTGLFLIPKGTEKIRPIWNYSRLSKVTPCPKMHLPSLFQLLKKETWPPNLHYATLDFKDAFLNIPIHEKSKKYLSFKHNNKVYTMNRLPFGINIAPYVCQKFTTAITNKLRELGAEYAWSHIDDIIIAHKNKTVLRSIIVTILELLTKAKWRINAKKSSLEPKDNVIFLGANWSKNGVTRTEETTRKIISLLDAIPDLNPKGKALQMVRGYLVYYSFFAGNYYPIINKWLDSKDKKRHLKILHYIFNVDHISFNHNKPTSPAITIYSDATTEQQATIIEQEQQKLTIIRRKTTNILEAELQAALIGPLYLIEHKVKFKKLQIYIDNMAVLYFLRQGTCHWALSLEILYTYIFTIEYIKKFFFCNFHYINSASNPADAPSRQPNITIPLVIATINSGVTTDCKSV